MDLAKFTHIIESWDKPVVFVDTNHRIKYMNGPAKRRYSKWGDVVGRSIFDCHKEKSREMIEKAYRQLLQGAIEVLVVESTKHRVFMRSVRDESGTLMGYYEKHERKSTALI